MKKLRPHDQRIPDIKSVRRLTYILGKLGINSCISTYRISPLYYNNKRSSYGLGLAEAKAYIENKYDYKEIT